MWFARLFGARKGHAEDEQPTAPPVQPKATPRGAAPLTTKTRRRANDSHRKGFDPYNSGSFERKAWERVPR